MICPRCGNEWDARKGACTRCGFVIRMTGQAGSIAQPPSTPQRGGSPSGGMSTLRQQSGALPAIKQPSGGMPGVNQQSNGMPYTSQRPFGGMPGVNQQSNGLPYANQQPFGGMPMPRQQSGGLSFSQPPGTPRPPSPTAGTSVSQRGSTLASTPTFTSDATFTKPAFEKNVLQRMPSGRENDSPQASPRPGLSGTDSLSFKTPVQSYPSPLRTNRSMDHLQQGIRPSQTQQQAPIAEPRTQRQMQSRSSLQSPPLPAPANQFSMDSLRRDVQSPVLQRPVQRPASILQQLPNTPVPSAPLARINTLSLGTRPLLPGVLLRGGRYRLQELVERQDWLSGVFEAVWIGKDAQRAGSQVLICEVVLPENRSVITQSILRTATMVLASVGRHPHIPTLWDAFSDQGRSFFVFEPIEGESLLTRMRHSGRTLQEQEVIECCLQMTEVLELLAQQSPPLVHGLIRPEHIIMGRNGLQYILTNFSIVLAGGATQFISGMDRSRLSPYSAPEVVRGVLDVRTDLYSLIATAYHAVTGNVPSGISGSIPPAQRINGAISPQFDAILAKGLRAVPSQRYQRPSELRQDLLAMRSVSSTLVSGHGNSNDDGFPGGSNLFSQNTMSPFAARNGQRFVQPVQRPPETVAQSLPILMTTDVEEDERVLLLPQPEELPPMKESNDMLNAALLLGGLLVCFIIIAVLSQIFG